MDNQRQLHNPLDTLLALIEMCFDAETDASIKMRDVMALYDWVKQHAAMDKPEDAGYQPPSWPKGIPGAAGDPPGPAPADLYSSVAIYDLAAIKRITQRLLTYRDKNGCSTYRILASISKGKLPESDVYGMCIGNSYPWEKWMLLDNCMDLAERRDADGIPPESK